MVMVNYHKQTLLAAAMLMSMNAFSAEPHLASEDAVIPQVNLTAPATGPLQAPTALPEAAAVPPHAKPVEVAQEAPTGRFIERKGTGTSKVVRAAAPVVLPEGPLGKVPGDITKLIGKAQRAGGQQMDAIQKEMNLPGLKKDDPSLKPFVLHTRNGINEIVRMSSRLLNRVATPFKKPAIIDTTNSTNKVVGSDIYYLPSGDKPIGLYIVDSANTSQTISLTVIPSDDLPGQNLIVKLEDLRAVDNLAVANTPEEAEMVQPRANDYSGFVRSLMTQAVRGKISGFSPVPLEGGSARIGSVDVTPDLAFTGSVVDIYRYKLLNSGTEPIDLVETAFYRKGVKAISFFPGISLNVGESGYVFLLADKPSSAASAALGAQ